ncbi:MAG: hypothetical protein ACRDPT_10375 [Streptomycetales bacterium]
MSDLPRYVWALVLVAVTAIPALTCVALYRGAISAGLGRSAGTVAGGAAALLPGGELSEDGGDGSAERSRPSGRW